MSRSSISQPCSLALLERAHILLLPSEPYMANCQEYSYIISNQSCDVAIPEHSKSAQLRKVKQNSQDVPSLRVLRPKSREEHDEMFWSKDSKKPLPRTTARRGSSKMKQLLRQEKGIQDLRQRIAQEE